MGRDTPERDDAGANEARFPGTYREPIKKSVDRTVGWSGFYFFLIPVFRGNGKRAVHEGANVGW